MKMNLVRGNVYDSGEVCANVKGYLTDYAFLAFPTDGSRKLQRYFVPTSLLEQRVCKKKGLPYLELSSCQFCDIMDRSFEGLKPEIIEYQKYQSIPFYNILNDLMMLPIEDTLVNATFVSYNSISMNDDFYYSEQSSILKKRSNGLDETKESLSHSISIFRQSIDGDEIIPLEYNQNAVYVANRVYPMREVKDDTYITTFENVDWKNMSDHEIIKVLNLYHDYMDKEKEKTEFQKSMRL